MNRPYHWLRRSKHVGFPRRQIALYVAWERTPRVRSPTVADERLASWTAQEWSGGPGTEKWEASGSGCDADSFWRWLTLRLRRRTCTWVWQLGAAHGLTMLGFWERITDGRCTLSRGDCRPDDSSEGICGHPPGALVVVNDPPTIILAGISGRSGSVRFVDVRNLGMESWSDVGAAKGQCQELATWLQGWSRVVDELRLGGLRHTAAAQAWHGWRHSYLECGVLVHGNEEAARLERDSVHPGRAEAFRIGMVGGPVCQYDASAFYPSCAVAGSLPVRLKWCGACNLGDVRAAVARGWLAICECRVVARRALAPCRIDARGSPAQRRRGGVAGRNDGPAADRTVWPVGSWTVTLPWVEIEWLLGSGVEVSVMRACLYEPGQPVTRFVSELWRARETYARQGRRAERAVVKLIMNSLVGKWAAHGHVWSEAPEALPPSDWHTWYAPYGPEGALHRYRSIGWHVQREDVTDETPESVPALASWVYGVGRVRLNQWIETAGWDDVYYVDSDSLFCSERAAERLARSGAVEPGALGALRLQGVHPSLRIGGIRDYTAGSRKVQAGTPRTGTETHDGLTQWWRPSSVGESVAGRRAPEPVARLITVPVHRAYRHGTVGTDGRVSPLIVEE